LVVRVILQVLAVKCIILGGFPKSVREIVGRVYMFFLLFDIVDIFRLVRRQRLLHNLAFGLDKWRNGGEGVGSVGWWHELEEIGVGSWQGRLCVFVVGPVHIMGDGPREGHGAQMFGRARRFRL
jgi:hypothetical protein